MERERVGIFYVKQICKTMQCLFTICLLHKFCLIGCIRETDYTIHCWRHLQTPQMVPADADGSERLIAFSYCTYEPKSELTGITVCRQRVNICDHNLYRLCIDFTRVMILCIDIQLHNYIVFQHSYTWELSLLLFDEIITSIVWIFTLYMRYICYS